MAGDHYRTLGASPGASAADLRAAYLRLARQHHPDRFVGPERDRAELRMREINEAWNVLGVAHKRREYDATRTDTFGHRFDPGPPRRGRSTFEPFDFEPFDGEPLVRDDIDLDETPISGSRAVPRWLSFAPVLLVVLGASIVGFGAMVNGPGVVALGAVSIGVGLAGFLLLPLLVMSRAEKDPDL